jgi:hypothetical protein
MILTINAGETQYVVVKNVGIDVKNNQRITDRLPAPSVYLTDSMIFITVKNITDAQLKDLQLNFEYPAAISYRNNSDVWLRAYEIKLDYVKLESKDYAIILVCSLLPTKNV